MALVVYKNERVIPVDIDDTLVMHGAEGAHWVTDHPDDWVFIEDYVPGRPRVCLAKNKPMIKVLQEELARGAQIVAWSRQGHQWAVNVLTALGFDTHASDIIVLTKPVSYFDDKDVKEWMIDRVFIGPHVKYKE